MTAVLLLALPVGGLVGAVGVGGVLLVPALIWLAGLDAHLAVGTATWCFLFTGLVGTLTYARRQAMPWRFAGLLTVGAAPAAAAGALVNGHVPAAAVQLILAVVTAGSGVYNLCARFPATGGRHTLPAAIAVAVGAVVGFGSALTGTGGPVLLVPVLLALGVAPLTTVAASQLIQLPLVGFASLAYAGNHLVDYRLGTVLGVLAGAGVLVGAATARRLRNRHLHRLVSATLVAVGAFLFATLLQKALS
jgi:uncharacterized membrane protein YfcA